MNQLTALFKIEADRLAGMRAAQEQRAVQTLEVTVKSLSDALTEVRGRAQDVMFLIGEVAAQGEDCLLTAYFVEADLPLLTVRT
jgi:hypothetical protein